MTKKDRIYLLGFMGAGKTTVGKTFAKNIGYAFLDLDQWIEDKEAKKIVDIFQRHGEQSFRFLEAIYIRQTLSLSKTVIACGGGTPIYWGNLQWMLDNGLSVFIDAKPEVITERLLASKSADRPLLLHKNKEQAFKLILKKQKERLRYYQQADFTVRADGTVDDVVSQIKNLLPVL